VDSDGVTVTGPPRRRARACLPVTRSLRGAGARARPRPGTRIRTVRVKVAVAAAAAAGPASRCHSLAADSESEARWQAVAEAGPHGPPAAVGSPA
jgi:hypothetical protein